MITVLLVLAVAAVITLAAGPGGRPFRSPHLSWEKWAFLFLSSAFLGCFVEACFVWIRTGTLMSPSSLLYGAFNIVWGLAAILMTLALNPLQRYGVWEVFVGGGSGWRF